MRPAAWVDESADLVDIVDMTEPPAADIGRVAKDMSPSAVIGDRGTVPPNEPVSGTEAGGSMCRYPNSLRTCQDAKISEAQPSKIPGNPLNVPVPSN